MKTRTKHPSTEFTFYRVNTQKSAANSMSTRGTSKRRLRSKLILFEFDPNLNFSLESTLYNQTHTKTMLAADKDVKSKLLSKIRGENAVSDRAIKQNKLAQNKKDEKNKKLR